MVDEKEGSIGNLIAEALSKIAVLELRLQEIDEAIVLESYRDTMITDALLRITALENLVKKAGIISEEDITSEILSLSATITKAVSEKSSPKAAAEVEKWLGEFSIVNKKIDKNSN